MNPYFMLFLFFLGITSFVVAALTLNAILGPKPKATDVKLEPFECGAEILEKDNVRRIHLRYYALAIVFILFDLEGVFLYLWASSSTAISTFSLMAFSLFMFFFILLLAYVWKQKILDFN